MRVFSLLLAAVMVSGARPAAAEDSVVHVVTYLEVTATSTESAVPILRQLAAASQKDDGNLHSRVLRETAKDNRFVVLQAWKEQKSLEANRTAEHTQKSLAQLAAIRNSPPDERLHNALWLGPAKDAPSGAVYVVTHVDVPPPRKDEVIVLLKRLGEASAREPANFGFDVVQQTNRPNHFSVIEVWAERKSLDAHEMTPHARQFRDELGPMLGAPYDDRIYRPID